MKSNHFLKLAILGLQHVLAMYAGAVAVPLILGAAIGLTQQQITYLVAADLFSCGVATLLQSYGLSKFIGIKLPVVMGCAFTAIAPMIAIAKSSNMATVYGSIIAAGLLIFFITPFFKKLIILFPPIVIGSIIVIIGLSLITVAMNNIGGGLYAKNFGASVNIFLAGFVLLFIIALNKYTKGFLQAIAVLLGLIGGTFIAYLFGVAQFIAVANADWFHLVYPFYFGLPKFSFSGMLAMSIVMIIAMIESTGNFYILGDLCERKIDKDDIANGLRAEGLAQVFGGIFNSFPYTTYEQNIAVVTLTRTKSASVTISAGFILIILSFFPKFAACATIIPKPVLGGAMIAMFGTLISLGIKMLKTVNFEDVNNLLIIACSIGLGMGITVTPGLFAAAPPIIRNIFDNGIVSGSLVAIVLNLFLNGFKSSKILT